MQTLIQFGAGNIGRSFIGQLFARNGYEVVFVDISTPLVEALNERREYRIVIKRNGAPDEELAVQGVHAIDGRDTASAAEAVATADYVATSVGLGALPDIIPTLAQGVALRAGRFPDRPLDIIIAENIRDGARYFREALKSRLPQGFPLDEHVGFVETSIGKMVPLMRAEDLAGDPLLIFAEAYDELIVDRYGFKGPLPRIPTLNAVGDIRAYVDRKLFIHNLGHAAAAYFGYSQSPESRCIWQALELPAVAARHGLPFDTIAAAVRAAIGFRATDEEGRRYPRDAEFVARELPKGLPGILRDVCGLSAEEPCAREVWRAITEFSSAV